MAAVRSLNPEPAGATPAMTEHVIWHLHNQLIDCLVDPERCTLSNIVAPGSPAEHVLSQLLADRVATRLRALPVTKPVSRRMGPLRWTDDEAVAQWCWVDDLVLVDDSLGSSLTIIVDDTEVSLSEIWSLRVVEGAWRLDHRDVHVVDRGRSPWCV